MVGPRGRFFGFLAHVATSTLLTNLNPAAAESVMTSVGSVPVMAAESEMTLAETGSKRTLRWCTYNIMHHGLGRLQQVLKSCSQMNMDFGILTETKFTNEAYPRSYHGYHIRATEASNVQGGVVVFWREQLAVFSVESVKLIGPNILSFELVSGRRRWRFIGVYIPPSEDNGLTLQQLESVLDDSVSLSYPVVVAGDINVDLLRAERSPRDIVISTVLMTAGLTDMCGQFYQRSRHRDRWTWSQKREGTISRARNDAILCTDRRFFQNVKITDPPGCHSDHYMLVATMSTAVHAEHKAYLKGRRHIPFPETYDFGQTGDLDRMLLDLQQHCEKETVDNPSNPPDWIGKDTWDLLLTRAKLAKQHTEGAAVLRQQLHGQIKSLLRRDRKNRAIRAGSLIEEALRSNNTREAYGLAKRWYSKVSGRGPPPAREDLEKTASDFEALYSPSTLSGDFQMPVVGHMGFAVGSVVDSIPTSEEILEQVRRLHNNRAPGFTGMRAEDVKSWASAYRFAIDNDLGKDNLPFTKLVHLIQECFRTGKLPKALHISTLVLIPKPGSADYRGIGLLEVAWKLISAIIDGRLKNGVTFQDEIHGFRQSRGTGTAVLCNKLQCQKAHLQGDALKQVYLDLSKAYDTLDRQRTIAILELYGVGPCVLRLLDTF